MAQLKAIDEISKGYAAAILSNWNGDLGFTPAALKSLRGSEFDQIDVLEIVEDGSPTAVSKEDAHETIIQVDGTTVLGKTLRVILSFNPHLSGLCVEEVLAL